jgi:hypothetical protein
MKKRQLLWVVVVMAVCLYSTSAFALDPMGSPTAELITGQFRLGADYSESRMDLKLGHGLIIDNTYDLGFLIDTDATKTHSFTLKNLKMHKLYGNIGYGINEDWEIFLRLGGMNTEFKGNFFPTTSTGNNEYNGDTGKAIGFGTKATFYKKDKLKLGGLFQMSWAESKATFHSTSGASITESIAMKIMEMQIAAGANYQLTDKIAIYGGPFWHFVNMGNGSYHGRRTSYNASEGITTVSTANYDIDDLRNFGGYIGMQFEIADNTFYYIEYQHTSAADALAMNLNWRF